MQNSAAYKADLKSSREELEAVYQKNKNEAIKGILIFVGVKAVIYYGLYRLAKSASKAAQNS